MEMTHGVGGESRVERAAPWVSSFLMHAAIGLLAAFVVFVAVGPKGHEEGDAVISIPMHVDSKDSLVDDTEAKMYPRTSEDVMPSVQNRLRNAKAGADPFARVDNVQATVPGMGETKLAEMEWITTGPGGSAGLGNGVPNGMGAGDLALFGPKPVIGSGPQTRSKAIVAKRVVYLVDHSGSMLDTFDYLREEVKSAVNRLQPYHFFSVIMFSEDVTVLGPEHLERATKEAMGKVCTELGKIRAAGENDGMLKPFQEGFERAMAMKPQAIIFLTDGNFDPRLVEVVKQMNKDHAVRIYTIAYVEITPEAEEGLRTIAKESGGTFKFVREKDLGK